MEKKFVNYKIDNYFFKVKGLLYYDDNNNFERLPISFNVDEGVNKGKINPSGGYIVFETNSTSIGINVSLRQKSFMPHMSATGSNGLDLYTKCNNKYIFIGTTKVDKPNYSYTYIKDLNSEFRLYYLYLPLYMELLDLEIILDIDSDIKQIQEQSKPKLLCYGTSITQGGCASRPGMAYPAILGRIQNKYEIFNLGFSGSAHLQEKIVEIINDTKLLECLIVEVEANAGDESGVLEDRIDNFFFKIINQNPDLKIFLISHFPHPHSLLNKVVYEKIKKHKKVQKDIAKKYSHNIIFIDGEKLLKDTNFEETVDSIHLTDLGFYNLAVKLNKIILKNMAN